MRTVAMSAGFIVYEFFKKHKAITGIVYVIRHRAQAHQQY